MQTLGIIESINPREIWKNEEYNFTPWLFENMEQLSKLIGIPIEAIEKEKRVGNYELDIYGKVLGTDQTVVIENQLETSDHRHLGQLLTYASGLNASIIIWVTPKVNSEHKKAIEWLNEISNDDRSFFLIRPEVIKIGDSNPAVQFHLEASPSDFERRIKNVVSGRETHRHHLRRLFWSGLIEYCEKNDLPWGQGRKTTKDSWMTFAVGKSGFSAVASMAMKSRLKAELSIDIGDKEVNEEIFDELYEYREEIEAKYNVKFEWEKLENSKVSRVALYKTYDKEKLEYKEEYRVEMYKWLEKNITIIRSFFQEYMINKGIIDRVLEEL